MESRSLCFVSENVEHQVNLKAESFSGMRAAFISHGAKLLKVVSNWAETTGRPVSDSKLQQQEKNLACGKAT